MTEPYIPNTTNCILWLDANDSSTTIFSSGTSMSLWNDKSGAGNHMTKMGTTEPTLVSNTLNGRSVVNTTSGGYFQKTGMVFPSMYSIFAVAYTPVTNSWNRLVGSLLDGYLLFGVCNGQNIYLTGNGGYNDYNLNSPAFSGTSWNIKEFTNTGVGTNAIPYANGTAQTTRVGTTVSFTGLEIGNGSGNGGPWSGYIAEVLIYNSVLSDTDRQTIEGYLAWKWGLQSNLPVDHTYKTAAPVQPPVNPLGTDPIIIGEPMNSRYMQLLMME
jgi:hypothetical protein